LATIETRRAWDSPIRRPDADGGFAGDLRRISSAAQDIDDHSFDEPRWPAWKVTVAVVIICGAFWMGVGYLAMRLLG